ncbi:hypothetical protein MD484_g8406, partial [Candolleomyces efflorescens]
MSYTSPVTASQSSGTVHSLPSPSSLSLPSLALLNPSATTFTFPATCLTSTIWYANIPFNHLACVALNFSLNKKSLNA